MEELFTYHIEYKELSPLIVQRAIRLYIEQFDPDKLYLMKHEVKPYLELSPAQIEHIQAEFKKDNFSYFVALTHLFQDAIERNRALRKEIEEDLIKSQAINVEGQLPKNYLDYAGNYYQLKKRIEEQSLRYLKAVSAQREFALSDLETKRKAFKYFEKVKRHQEKNFGSEAVPQKEQEHLMAMYILKAATRALDAHSLYFSPEEAFELRAALKKQFDGLGIVFKETFDGVYVSELVKGGPADRSRLVEVGDYLLEVDGKSVADSSYEGVLEALLGPENSKVSLTLERSGKPVKITLRRERITIDNERLSYSYEPYGDGIIAKMTLPAFYDNGEGLSAENDMREAFKILKQQGPIYGLVLDMRMNAGGFLSQAVKVASLFISRGVIVISKYSDGEVRYFRDLDGRFVHDGPFVILTSKLSASAAEIVAQALQDYGQALIVGDVRSYGKGTMQYQTVTDDDATRFFTITVGRFYTVSGRSNQIEGVEADIVVPSRFAPYKIGERYLEYPLPNDSLEFSLFDTLNMQQKKAHRAATVPVPYLQRRETEWRKMVPTLAKNSQERLAANKNFQLFLKKVESSESITAKSNYGSDDLQMTESVNIVKDMARIHQENSR